MKHHEVMYTQYRPVRQTKISANMHYVPNSQNLLFAKYIKYTVYNFMSHVSLMSTTIKYILSIKKYCLVVHNTHTIFQ